MSLEAFTVWDPEEGDADAGLVIRSTSSERAAEHFIEREWEGEDHAREIHVRDEAGEVTRWSVIAVQSVDFNATELAPESEAAG